MNAENGKIELTVGQRMSPFYIELLKRRKVLMQFKYFNPQRMIIE